MFHHPMLQTLADVLKKPDLGEPSFLKTQNG